MTAQPQPKAEVEPAPLRLAEAAPAAPAVPASGPRRFRRGLLIAALPLVLAISGGYLWTTGGRYVGTKDAYVKQNRVSVVAQVSGEIAEVAVAENQPVKANDLLFRIDNSAYRNVVEQDQARLEQARLEVQKLKAAHAQAVAELDVARNALDTAQTRDTRQKALLKSGVVPQAAADDSALDLLKAEGAVAKAESGVLSAKAALAGNPDIATDDHPEVLQALAALHAAELDLSHTVVTAPADGVISQTSRLQQGQYVTPSTAVLSLVETGESWIEANFKETDLAHMREGQPVEVTINSYGDRVLHGRINSIGAGTGSEFALLPAQNATGNWVKVVQRVPLRVTLEPGQDLPALRAGMSAGVKVDTGHARGLPQILTDLGIGAAPAVGAEPGAE